MHDNLVILRYNTLPRKWAQGFRAIVEFIFRQRANVAQAFGQDALAWAKYQCPSQRVDFQGDTDDFSAPWVEDPMERRTVMPQNY
jgi:hypothetical protein